MTLMTGTAFAQAILILSTPILTRLYSPEDFGIYGNFIAVTAIITVIVALRYELAIVLPKEDSKAKNILKLSVLIALSISTFLFLLVVLFGDFLATNLNWIDREYLYFIPFYAFMVGLFQILNYWFTRTKNFKRQALAQSGKSFFTVGAQLLLGVFAAIGTFGLIIGQMVGQLFAVGFLLLFLLKNKNVRQMISFKASELKKLAIEYKDFPLYSSWNSFINTISLQIPIIIITYYFSASIAGFYMLGHRLLSLPMGIISSSISQVFLQKLAKDKADEEENKNSYKLWKVLTPISVFFNLVVILIAPWAFSLVFGPEWIVAGEYARWIAFWTVFQFVSSPLSSVSYTYNKQRLFLWFQIALLIFRVAALVTGGMMGDPVIAIALFAIVSGLFNLITMGMYIYIETGKKEATKATLVNAVTFTALLSILLLT